MILAIEHGHLSLVKLLLENGANINDKTDKGFTPLMIGIE
jgi:ankyrin repeat protein